MSKDITLGIFGSGQLGTELVKSAKKLGVKTIVFSNDKNGPAQKFSDSYIFSDYNDVSNFGPNQLPRCNLFLKKIEGMNERTIGGAMAEADDDEPDSILVTEEMADLSDVPFEQVGGFLLLHSSSQGTVLAESAAEQAAPLRGRWDTYRAAARYGGFDHKCPTAPTNDLQV